MRQGSSSFCRDSGAKQLKMTSRWPRMQSPALNSMRIGGLTDLTMRNPGSDGRPSLSITVQAILRAWEP